MDNESRASEESGITWMYRYENEAEENEHRLRLKADPAYRRTPSEPEEGVIELAEMEKAKGDRAAEQTRRARGVPTEEFKARALGEARVFMNAPEAEEELSFLKARMAQNDEAAENESQ